MRVTHRTSRIAPRLESGDTRLAVFLNLPPEVKDGLRNIAMHEHQSISWVLEQAVYDYFGISRPAFKFKKEQPKKQRRLRAVR